MTEVRISGVRVEGRHRRDLGDVAALAASIREVGLIHPVAITADMRLVAGQRRLEAAKLLGWDTIPATVVSSLPDAAALLRAECDENTQRKPFTPTEAESIASAVEAALRPVAVERYKDTVGRPKIGAESAPISETKTPKTRDIAAQAVGYSHDTISKVRKVKEVAEDPEAPEPVREVAREALEEMDATGSVAGAHNRVVCALEREAAPKPHPGVTEWLESDQDLQDRMYLSAFHKAVRKTHDVFLFDAERIGRICGPDDVRTVELVLDSTQRFLDKMRASRIGLRLIGGDKR